ncbi:MAG: tryptophan synthase subunit alpha [Gammaproteobacteria bacterium]|nr:tryptophan synthase subunit alpha [Gammaproteobacteria bacterium]
MSRIASRFAALRKTGRKALIPYITAGDPAIAVTVPLLHAMVAAGADIVEIGVPFSDPMAEGPVIQRAMERALVNQVSLARVLAMVYEFRHTDTTTPVILMGYLNPVEVMGYTAFASAAAQAGVDGILLVDMPPEEAEALLIQTRGQQLDMIFLVAPTTTDQRIAHIVAASSGFIYYVSLKGVTGAGHLESGAVQQRVLRIKTQTSLPVGVGFGITDANAARAIAQVADAVVVGSALVKHIEAHQHDIPAMHKAVTKLLQEMRNAMDGLTQQPSVAGI